MRWARLLLCFVLPLGSVLLLAPGAASAATTAPAEPAPMCDPNGASVAAGEDIPEIDHGRFEALPCEAQLWIAGARLDLSESGCHAGRIQDADPAAPLQRVQASRARHEAASQVGIPFPERGEPLSALFGDGEGLAPSRGFAHSLFRPPVA